MEEYNKPHALVTQPHSYPYCIALVFIPFHSLLFFYFLIFICLFIWQLWVLVAARDPHELLFAAGIEPGPPALGARSLSHWTTREVPIRGSLVTLCFLP